MSHHPLNRLKLNYLEEALPPLSMYLLFNTAGFGGPIRG